MKAFAPVMNALIQQREEQAYHQSYHFEKSLLDAIRTGDPDRTDRILNTGNYESVGEMSRNSFRQMQYSFIVLVTMVSRAAIEGGLPEETALCLSDYYCQQMDQMTAPEDIIQLFGNMTADYCNRVAGIRDTKHWSSSTKKCCDYISKHLHEKITLADLFKTVHISTNLFSARFRKETGRSIPEYINRQRIEEAKYLMMNTGMTLSQISAFLLYSSQSFFTRKFKQVCGMTPQEWRNSQSQYMSK